MPIFEYRCDACGREFEKIHLSRESVADVACPKCESPKVVKKLSTFAMSGVSKGSDDFGDFGGGGDDFGGGGDDFGGGDDGGMEAGGAGCGRCGGPQSCSFD